MRLPTPRRYEAFTVLELLVVLVISALLFGMAYTALRAVQRQQRVIERKSALLGQISTWQTALATDFDGGSLVQVAHDQIRCSRPDGLVVYTYSFPDSTLVREQGEITDTFQLPVRQCTYFWQGQPCVEGPIDEIMLMGVTAQDTFYLQANALYSAQQLATSLIPTP